MRERESSTKVARITCVALAGAYALLGAAAIHSAEGAFVKKSHVYLTQPRWDDLVAEDQGVYADYQADAVMWGFTPTTYPGFTMGTLDINLDNYINGLINHDLASTDWVSRVEWDVIWEGMTEKYPNTYQQAFATRLDGEALPIDWFPGHFFFSTHSPIFQEYLRWQIEDIAFHGEAGPGLVDALLFDSQQSTPAHYYWGGDFSDGCMANFRQWLEDNYSGAQLAAMGIDDVATFHYGDYLMDLGWTADSYEAATVEVPNNIPLTTEYRQFLLEYNNQHLAELVAFAESIAEQKGYPDKPGVGRIAVGTSSPILDPYWNGIRFPYTDAFDFYVQEFNHRANLQAPSSDAMLMYKIGEALGKPLAMTAQPFPDWDYMVDHPTELALPRSWIAQAYANGAVFMTPVHMWSYNDFGQRYYDPQEGDYDYIYRWISDNSYLFDNYETVANVALVYSHGAYRASDYDSLDLFAAAAGLMEQNIPYKLLIAGDEGWPKYLTDADQSSAIDDYQAVVVTDFNGIALDQAQQAVLDNVNDKVVEWPNVSDILALQPRQINTNATGVALFPRETTEHPHPHAPKVVHLVNRDYDAATATMRSKSNLTVTIDDSLFGISVVGARYNQAGEPAIELPVTHSGGQATVQVPTLSSWGLLELFDVTDIPSKEDLEIPEQETRLEGFDNNDNADAQGYVFLDGQGSNNEQIQRFDPQQDGPGWAWGGYSSGAEISQNTQWEGLVQFQQGAKTGTRIYTRFDTSSPLGGSAGAAQNSVRADLSPVDAALVINLAISPEQEWAMLLRDDENWWQSSAITFPNQGWDTQRSSQYLISSLSWTALDPASAGVLDMDEVDAGGEADIALTAVGASPKLDRVEGFGLMALEDSSSVTSLNGLGLANVYFHNPDTAPPQDSDGDGVNDGSDAFPNDPTEWLDTDSDGIGNNTDSDDDNDGYSDSEELAAGTDPLNPNDYPVTQIDSDGDGVDDANDAFPLDPTESVDTDGDGIGNNADNDDDGDGVNDASDAFPLNPAESVDTDGDGIGNNADNDDDGDGVNDANDAFPLNPAESVDTDGDGIGNNADNDDDGDGVDDSSDAFPLDSAESVDTDGDGIGNNADNDDDGDGFTDSQEIEAGTDPLNPSDKPVVTPPTLVQLMELFDHSVIPGQMYNLDNSGGNNEYIGRFSQGWAWGGYTSGSTITHNTQWGGLVQFQGGAKVGSRIYTRFDTSSALNGGSQANTPSILVDMSHPSSQLVVNVAQSPGQNWAMLVRDNQGWWQSSAIPFAQMGFNANRSDTNIQINSLSWTRMNPQNGGVLDMDQMDQGGEAATATIAGGSINLSQVEGFGLMALQGATSFFSINELGLANVSVTTQ